MNTKQLHTEIYWNIDLTRQMAMAISDRIREIALVSVRTSHPTLTEKETIIRYMLDNWDLMLNTRIVNTGPVEKGKDAL